MIHGNVQFHTVWRIYWKKISKIFSAVSCPSSVTGLHPHTAATADIIKSPDNLVVIESAVFWCVVIH